MLQVSSSETAWLRERAATRAEATLIAHVNRARIEAFNVTAKISGSNPTLAPVVVMALRSGSWQCASEQGTLYKNLHRESCWISRRSGWREHGATSGRFRRMRAAAAFSSQGAAGAQSRRLEADDGRGGGRPGDSGSDGVLGLSREWVWNEGPTVLWAIGRTSSRPRSARMAWCAQSTRPPQTVARPVSRRSVCRTGSRGRER
jgi:hypothetical protein